MTTRAVRQPHEWLTLVAGLLAALVWASLALRALVADDEVSTRALFACAALVLVGFALGAVTRTLGATKRRRRSPGNAGALVEMKAPLVLLALVSIGLGASPIVSASATAWDWALLVGGSLVGGLNLGVVSLGNADRALRESATASRSGD